MHKRSKRTMGGRITVSARCDVCQKRPIAAFARINGEEVGVCGRCREAERISGRFSSEVEIGNMREEVAEDFGERIRKAREKSGLSHGELARKISEKSSYVKKLERGQFVPTVGTAKKIEKALGIRIIRKTMKG